MFDMFYGLTEIIQQIVLSFSRLVENVYHVFEGSMGLDDFSFNIYLFSDTGWFTEPMYFGHLLIRIFGIFMFIFVLRLLWKGTKKFINVVFGVFRV